MYSHVLGIEHLMTGVQFFGKSPIRFERNSPSTVKALSDGPFDVYWPVKQVFQNAVELPETEPSWPGESKPMALPIVGASGGQSKRS